MGRDLGGFDPRKRPQPALGQGHKASAGDKGVPLYIKQKLLALGPLPQWLHSLLEAPVTVRAGCFRHTSCVRKTIGVPATKHAPPRLAVGLGLSLTKPVDVVSVLLSVTFS